MFKMLLASTALATLVTTTAFAASETPATTTDTNAAVTTDTNTAATADVNVKAETGDTLASRLIGSSVYASAQENADMIGDINDIVLTPEGKVSAVIVGVGGFLGIGEKDVSVSYDAIEWVERDNDRWVVANMTREQLEAAPAFDRTALYPEDRAADAGAAATGEMTAEDATAKKVETGTSAVNTAENKTATIDRSSMTKVTSADLSSDNLIGRTVYSADDENIGEVGDVLLTADNKVEGFVLDVGGFLGMGEKQVAISPENLDIRANADGELTIFTPFTEAQLEAQAEYSKESWEAERDNVILVVPAG